MEFHFHEGRSARATATHCGLARRYAGQTLKRFEASGPTRPETGIMQDLKVCPLPLAASDRVSCAFGSVPDRARSPHSSGGHGCRISNIAGGRGRRPGKESPDGCAARRRIADSQGASAISALQVGARTSPARGQPDLRLGGCGREARR